MHFALHTSKTPASVVPDLAEAQIAVALDNNCYLLDDGRLAKQAASCLLQPEAGDRILTVSCRDGDNYVVHVLSRAGGCEDAAELNVPGARQLTIRQPQVSISATEQIALHALRDVDITAATGVLSLNARNLFTTVQESLVQNVRHFVGKAEQYLLDAKQLLKLHGKQALVTAEHDVKVDGERISMG